jgi:hypothetical protein
VVCLLLVLTLCLMVFLITPTPRDACAVAAQLPRYPASALPKIIHVQWPTKTLPGKDSMQARVYSAYQTLFPQHEIRIWTDDDMLNLISTDFAWFLPIFLKYPRTIQRVDSSRYFILYKYGGLYSDLDYVPFTNFWEVINPNKVSIVESPIAFAEKVQNSMMASPIGDKFWLIVFEELKRRAKDDKLVQSVSESAGTAMLSFVAEKHGDLIDVLPCEVFMRLSPMRWTDNDVVVGFLYKKIFAYTPLIRSCGGRFNDLDPCMWAGHYGTNTWATMFRVGGT